MKQHSRRNMIAQTLIGMLGIQAARAEEGAKSITPAKAIHQEEDFGANPNQIYEALLNASQFKAFSGHAAEIDRTPGGSFSLFDGQIVGRNLDLLPNRRIVQAWRVAAWSEGLYSIARFDLHPKNTGTKIVFDHTGFPSESAEHLLEGWQAHYWLPLRKYLS